MNSDYSDYNLKNALTIFREKGLFTIDWAQLHNLVVLRLDELCALSVGIAPTYVQIIWGAIKLDVDLSVDELRTGCDLVELFVEDEAERKLIKEFRRSLPYCWDKAVEEWGRRVSVALNHVVAGTLPIVRATAPIEYTAAPINRYCFHQANPENARKIELKIADFVAWATSLPEPWEMPDELKRMGQLPDGEDKPLGQRAETTYLNIIGALLDLMLGKSSSGKPYSEFRSQEAVIDALLAHHKGKPGIAERTLAEKFAAAKRSLNAT